MEISRARRKFVSVMLPSTSPRRMTGCFRNNIMLPAGVKTLGQYIEEAGYETAYIGKWHLASDGELEKPPTIDHTVTNFTPSRAKASRLGVMSRGWPKQPQVSQRCWSVK